MKLNTVIQRGINEHAEDIIDLFSGRVDEIRFIEYMDTENNGWNYMMWSLPQIRKKLAI